MSTRSGATSPRTVRTAIRRRATSLEPADGEFARILQHSFRNLLPIILVVTFFQLAVMRQVPDDVVPMAIGLLVVVFGVALFLQGLELGIFPIGKNLSNDFAKKGSLPLLMAFGFCLGFSAVVAEPALIAVASQAELISEGRVDGFTLRILVALSVGAVVALGVVRTILGHSLHWYMIVGYLTVVTVTFFAPEEIVGLAYDSGGVTTNIVTVPLIAGLGHRPGGVDPGAQCAGTRIRACRARGDGADDLGAACTGSSSIPSAKRAMSRARPWRPCRSPPPSRSQARPSAPWCSAC
jgi:hypothetical protein